MAAVAHEPGGARAFVQRRARLDRRAREAAHIGQRIDLAAAPVDRGAEIVVAADHVGGLPTVQKLDRPAARLPVVDPPGVGAQRLLGVGRHDDARQGIAAVDAVALDQLGQDHGALLGGIDQPLAGGGAVAGDDLVGIVLGGGRQMAGIAAGGAPADLVGLDQHDPRTGLGGMERGRAPGDAAAHDRHVGALVAGEGAEPERRSGACAVGGVRRAGIVVQREMHGPATVRHFQVCRTGCVASDVPSCLIFLSRTRLR